MLERRGLAVSDEQRSHDDDVVAATTRLGCALGRAVTLPEDLPAEAEMQWSVGLQQARPPAQLSSVWAHCGPIAGGGGILHEPSVQKPPQQSMPVSHFVPFCRHGSSAVNAR